MKKRFKTVDIVERMWAGESADKIQADADAQARRASKEPGKKWGECDSCGEKTCLVEEVDLCGPCCFGESETAYGNW